MTARSSIGEISLISGRIMVGGFQTMEATNRGGRRDSPPGASRSFGAHLPSGTDDLLLRARGGEIMTDPSSSWPVGAGSTRYRPPVHLAGLVITKLGRGSVAPGEVAGHPLLDCSIGGVWLCRTQRSWLCNPCPR
jgi:hypothetical protein